MFVWFGHIYLKQGLQIKWNGRMGWASTRAGSHTKGQPFMREKKKQKRRENYDLYWI